MKENTNALAIASLVLGIISLLFSCCLGGFIGIVGVVLSILAIKANQKKAFAITGLITSILSIFITMVVIIIFILTPTDSENTDSSKTTENSEQISKNTESNNEVDVTEGTSEETASEKISEQLKNALNEIGMDSSNVRNIDSLDDWASGTRYSFVYDGYRYVVYELDNGEIASICNDNLSVKIFERGYEPLNYKDFEPDVSITQSLMDSAIEEVSKYITNETSLKTKLGSASINRVYDYYSISGEVKAKNKVDKETFSFTVDFEVKDGMHRCTYVSIDGSTAYGEQIIPEIKKEEIMTEDSTEGNDENIIISWNKMGSCGQKDLFDGDEYIRYYVPEGTYEVKCNVRGGFFIETVALHKEDGYDTADTISQNMMESGDTIEITIEEGQCISLILNTEIELKKK